MPTFNYDFSISPVVRSVRPMLWPSLWWLLRVLFYSSAAVNCGKGCFSVVVNRAFAILFEGELVASRTSLYTLVNLAESNGHHEPASQPMR